MSENSEKSETPTFERGINLALGQYFCGQYTWKINPEGHLPKIADKVAKLVDDYEQKAFDLAKGKGTATEARQSAQEAIRQICELGLLPKMEGVPNGFDFVETLNQFGWKTVEGIAIDLKTLFLDVGGLAEAMLSKKRLNAVKQSGSFGFEV